MKTDIIRKDVAVIGGGPAGMAVADKLCDLGITDIMLLEKENYLGGVLPQCIHDGFGLIKFGKNVSGPEYVEIYRRRMGEKNIDVHLCSTVTEVRGNRLTVASPDKTLAPQGLFTLEAGAVVLASGCRERNRSNAGIPGSRAAGIYTAGTAQAFINLHNLMPGKEIVILGSGDIGLIMARRLTLEGAHVKCVAEIDSVSGGLKRNIKQCLEDFDIPLLLNTTVTDVFGLSRVTGVQLSSMHFSEENGVFLPVPGTERRTDCDTLILSAGLIPENSILKDIGAPGTDVYPGIFLCGNALYVHGLVDDVSDSGEQVAKDVAEYISAGPGSPSASRYAFSQANETRAENCRFLSEKRLKTLADAGRKTITCILCPNSCEIDEDFSGGRCPRGAQYAREELTDPKRILTSSVAVDVPASPAHPTVSVRTSGPLPKNRLADAVKALKDIRVSSPVGCGDVIRRDFIQKGVDLIATGKFSG